MFRFHTFFHHIDHFHSDYFLWVTATGIPAARQSLAKGELASKEEGNMDADPEDESDTEWEES
jgi:tRNA pseudouridine38-40 synthase